MEQISEHNCDYFADVEHDVVEKLWREPIPTGPKRLKNKRWMKYIKDFINPELLDEYITWVKSGGGDDWMLDQPKEFELSEQADILAQLADVYGCERAILKRRTGQWKGFPVESLQIRFGREKDDLESFNHSSYVRWMNVFSNKVVQSSPVLKKDGITVYLKDPFPPTKAVQKLCYKLYQLEYPPEEEDCWFDE